MHVTFNEDLPHVHDGRHLRPAASNPAVGARTSAEVRAEPRPWGFWGSLGWGLFAVVTGLFAAIISTVVWR